MECAYWSCSSVHNQPEVLAKLKVTSVYATSNLEHTQAAAEKGQTAAPAIEEDVDLHFVALLQHSNTYDGLAAVLM